MNMPTDHAQCDPPSDLMDHVEWMAVQLFQDGSPNGSRDERVIKLLGLGSTPTDGLLVALTDGMVDAVSSARDWIAAHPNAAVPIRDVLEMIGVHFIATLKFASLQSASARAAIHVAEQLRKSVP